MIKVYKNTEKIPDCLEKGKAYNCDGVKKELAAIYNNKCCYCETKLTKNFEIEHFRPKEKYRWLEKSWSNLLSFAVVATNQKVINLKRRMETFLKVKKILMFINRQLF